MISAGKANNIAMLNIGDTGSYIAERIVSAAMRGDFSTTIPSNYVSHNLEQELRGMGYAFKRIPETGEALIGWLRTKKDKNGMVSVL